MAEIALHAHWDGPEQARANFLQRVAPWCMQQWEAGRRLEVFVRLHEDAKTTTQERISTESLGVREYGDLIDRVMAHAINELNVEFPATFEQWEREQTHPDTGEVIGGVCP
jgi:hypothetical protein